MTTMGPHSMISQVHRSARFTLCWFTTPLLQKDRGARDETMSLVKGLNVYAQLVAQSICPIGLQLHGQQPLDKL